MLKFTTVDTFTVHGRGVVHTGINPADFDPRRPGWFEALTAEPWEVDGAPRRVIGIEKHAVYGVIRAGAPIGLLLAPPTPSA